MNNFEYALRKSFDDMRNVIERILDQILYEEKERQELFISIGTCLHWILDYAERVEIGNDEKSLVSAFRYANNCLKHSYEVRELSEDEGGFEFPFEFPLEIPEREIVWAIAIDYNDKYANQIKNYEKLLDGKNVISTCEQVIGILLKYVM